MVHPGERNQAAAQVLYAAPRVGQVGHGVQDQADLHGALARSLGMSLRTLQRVARQRDLTVRGLIDQVRQAESERLLTDPSLSIAQVAFLVGYSDERACRRAFERWTGHSPAGWRRRS